MSVPSDYHEPGSRMQLAAKLQHLVRFSDFLLLIVGADGCGKSTLLHKLEQDNQAGAGRSARVCFEATADVTGLLQALTQALDLEPADNNQQRLSQLHALARQLAEDGLALVLLIDDADYLTNNALELLIQFATLEGAGAPRILLTGTPAFEQRFRDLELDQRLEGHLHIERLEPFTAQESLEFIESLLPDGIELRERQLRLLVERAAGRPARLRHEVSELLKQGAGGRQGRGWSLPPRHVSAALVILLLVFSLAIWQYLPEREEAPAVTERVTLPLALNTVPQAEVGRASPLPTVPPAVDATPAPAAERPAVQAPSGPKPEKTTATPAAVQTPPVTTVMAAASEASAAPPTAVSAPDPNPRAEPAAVEVPPGVSTSGESPAPATVPVAAEPAETVPEPRPQPAPAPAPPAVVQAPAPSADAPEPEQGPADRWLREQELLEWPQQGYTLQMLGAREAVSVKKFIEAQAQPERFYYFRTLFKGQPWHVVVYGQYADRAAAINAVKQLPPELQKLRPWARSIAGVKADIKKKNQ